MTASARQREWKVISVTLATNQNASAMGKTIEFTQVIDRCCGLDVHKKVIVATAHELLTIVYHSWRFRSFAANLDADMLTRGANDPEAGFFLGHQARKWNWPRRPRGNDCCYEHAYYAASSTQAPAILLSAYKYWIFNWTASNEGSHIITLRMK